MAFVAISIPFQANDLDNLVLVIMDGQVISSQHHCLKFHGIHLHFVAVNFNSKGM
jgi:hypothetical protein